MKFSLGVPIARVLSGVACCECAANGGARDLGTGVSAGAPAGQEGAARESHRLTGQVGLSRLDAEEGWIVPFVPVAATERQPGPRGGAGSRGPAADRAREAAASELLPLVRTTSPSSLRDAFAIRFPGRFSGATAPPADREEVPSVVLFWGTHDPLAQAGGAEGGARRGGGRKLELGSDRLRYEAADDVSVRLVLEPPKRGASPEGRRYRELLQGYPGIERRRPLRRLPYGELFAVALPGEAAAERTMTADGAEGYEVRATLCRLPVPVRNVRMVFFGYRPVDRRAEQAAGAQGDPLAVGKRALGPSPEEREDFARQPYFTAGEQGALLGGGPAARVEALRRAVERGARLEGLLFPLLTPSEQEAYEGGAHEARAALTDQAQFRLLRLLRCFPDLLSGATDDDPEEVTRALARAVEGLRFSIGGTRAR